MKKESAVKTVAKKAAEVKTAAEKAAPEVKAAVTKKTAEAKTAAKKAAPEVKAAVTKKTTEAKTAAKKAAPKKPAKTNVTLMLQYAGKEFSYDELVAKARGAWQGESIKELALYVKPEEDRVYMVVNGEEAGSFEL